ncbi:hypothetical protein CVIRNUC_003141 [Coccomyxa viridis]|uniref:Cleavage and polyadenylation specificity factor subunit 2 n=1 Tax=Coccomyxa viridis TaxID=1274662 RepID=A0AAV1HZD7_9CHLO|nr:hypothetical protein CVIRNUC_003141 [Coccomyxa viridis]
MADSVHFTPLIGAGSDGPICGLLQVYDLVILLDCGWDERCSKELLSPLKDVSGHLDAVLLTHPDPLHLGALPVLVGQLKCTAPIYATYPVNKMGQMFLYDQCLNRAAVSEFDAYDLNDVDAAFAHITTLKYQQVFSLSGNAEGFSITPFAAGHLLGGCAWRITTPGDEDIVYAVHYNHRKQGHLNASTLSQAFLRPIALITDADNALHNPPDNRAARDKDLLDSVVSTLRKGGNVLLPVDAAGRALELLLLLDRHWDRAKLYFTLVFVAPQARQVLELAKTQLTWMSDAVLQAFERTQSNPFALPNVKVCQSREQLAALPPGPKAVLATLPSLEAGPAQELFVEWAGDPHSLILFTERPPAGSLASAVSQGTTSSQPLALKLELGHREPLQGKELEAFYASRAAHALLEEEEEEEPQPSLTPRFSSGSIGKASRTSSNAARLGLLPEEPEEDGDMYEAPVPASDILVDGFIVPKGAAAPMFPFEDEDDELAQDDYGLPLRPGEFQLQDGTAPDFITGDVAKEGEESEQDEAGPTKVVTTEASIEVRARVLQLDYEGRSDGRSMHTILAHIAPRHLVLCHGSPQAVQALAASCARDLQGLNTRVHCPQNSETVDLSEGASSVRMEVESSVLSQAAMRVIGRYEMGWLQALVTQDAPDQAPKLAFAAQADEDEGTQGGIFIGDVKLSELKAALSKKSITAEFVAGSLLCADSILVRRTDDDTGLVLEGPLSDDFYTVRSTLYALYKVC